MELDKIRELKIVRSINEANQLLAEGWMLLAIDHRENSEHDFGIEGYILARVSVLPTI